MIRETTLYLVRHGQLANNHQKILNGQADICLSSFGLRQTMKWKKHFKKGFFSVVVSSDLKRTSLPGEQYGKHIGCEHRRYCDLREINAGTWEGKSMSAIMKDEAAYFKKRMRDPVRIPFPEGENLLQLKARVMRRVDALIKEFKGGNLLFLSHAGVIRTILLHYAGFPLKDFFKLEIDFGSLSILRIFEDDNVTIKRLNCLAEDYYGC